MPPVFLNPRLLPDAEAALYKFEVVAESSTNTVTQILSQLAMLEISPRALKAHGKDRTNMVVELCLDSVGDTDGQSIAREFLKLAETRRVSYRDSKGTGGTFVRDVAQCGTRATAPTGQFDCSETVMT